SRIRSPYDANARLPLALSCLPLIRADTVGFLPACASPARGAARSSAPRNAANSRPLRHIMLRSPFTCRSSCLPHRGGVLQDARRTGKRSSKSDAVTPARVVMREVLAALAAAAKRAERRPASVARPIALAHDLRGERHALCVSLDPMKDVCTWPGCAPKQK